MRSNIGTIVKKELARFWSDKKLFFTAIFMPGIMIYVMYTFLGNVLMDELTTSDDYEYKIEAYAAPESVKEFFNQAGFKLTDIDKVDDMDKVKADIDDENLDALIIFPEDFEKNMLAYDVASGEIAPEVDVYFNSSKTESLSCYNIVDSMLAQYEKAISNKFNVNEAGGEYDLATEEDSSIQIFSMLLPMLILTFLFSACISLAPDSIAGEKERGTIATLLVTPLKRSELAIGKILALSALVLLSGIVSCLGLISSLPSLIGAESGLTTSMYGMDDYISIFVVVCVTALLMIAIAATVSANAKSIKEAGTSITPLTFVVMAVGFSGMFIETGNLSTPMYLIPLFNSAQCFNAIFAGSFEVVNVVVTAASNLVYALVFVFILTKMFESEKVMMS